MNDAKTNAVIDALKSRRSCRNFSSTPVPQEIIDTVLDAGLYAPSGMGRQPVKILAITDKKIRDQMAIDNAKIGGFPEGTDPFYGAPVILAVLVEKDCPTGIYDGPLVMQNLMLAAHSLGLGSIWIHRAKEEFEMDSYKALLKEAGMEGEYEGIAHCAIGYVNGEIPPAAPRKENRIFYR